MKTIVFTDKVTILAVTTTKCLCACVCTKVKMSKES